MSPDELPARGSIPSGGTLPPSPEASGGPIDLKPGESYIGFADYSGKVLGQATPREGSGGHLEWQWKAGDPSLPAKVRRGDAFGWTIRKDRDGTIRYLPSQDCPPEKPISPHVEGELKKLFT